MAPVVVVDIDGVIATEGRRKVYSDAAGWAYEKCVPIKEGVDLLKGLMKAGVAVVLHTARPEKDYVVTKQWLSKHHVPYTRLVMGKPLGAVYLDDRSFPAFDPRQWKKADLLSNILLKVQHG